MKLFIFFVFMSFGALVSSSNYDKYASGTLKTAEDVLICDVGAYSGAESGVLFFKKKIKPTDYPAMIRIEVLPSSTNAFAGETFSDLEQHHTKLFLHPPAQHKDLPKVECNAVVFDIRDLAKYGGGTIRNKAGISVYTLSEFMQSGTSTSFFKTTFQDIPIIVKVEPDEAKEKLLELESAQIDKNRGESYTTHLFLHPPGQKSLPVIPVKVLIVRKPQIFVK